MNQFEEKIEYLTEENNLLNSKIEILKNENSNLNDKVNSLSRELYLANEKIKELSDEKMQNFNHNPKSTNKNNGNAFDSDNQEFKSTHSGGTNAIKFPNNKVAGYANIKNIDESELNESDYHNSNKKMIEFNKINVGMTDHKRENDLYVESGGIRKKIGDNKNDELFKMTNRVNSVDKDKSKINYMNNSGNNFGKINSNNTPNNNLNSKNDINDSLTDNLLNFENRSNSHNKYNRNIHLNNPYNNINTKNEGEVSLGSSKEKFHTINNNYNENNKSYGHINAPALKSSATNMNTDFNYNPMKTNESETSGRSSPQMKTNTKNIFYQTKVHKTEGNNRIVSDSDYASNTIVKNKIPLNNKNNKTEPFKVHENKNIRTYAADTSTSRFREGADSSEKSTIVLNREKTGSNFHESSDFGGSTKQSAKYETGNNFYSKNNNNSNNNLVRQSSINNQNDNEFGSLDKNKFTNNNLSPILAKNTPSNKVNSNNNSNPISPKINMNQDSRDEIKEFLLKVKERIPAKDFKDFISDIKLLTDRNNICNKKEIINHVNTIFQNHRDLYARFEEILLIKKN